MNWKQKIWICGMAAALLCGGTRAQTAADGKKDGQAASGNAGGDSTAKKLWADYITAGYQAVKSGDLKSGEIFFRAAAALSDSMNNPRRFISYGLLYENLYEQHDVDGAKEMFKKIPALDPPKIDRDLLPVATTLDLMANNRYDRWKELAATNDKWRVVPLRDAEFCERTAWKIREKYLGKTDRDRVNTEAFYGLIVQKKEDGTVESQKAVSDAYLDAKASFETAEKADSDRDRNSEHMSLIRPEGMQNRNSSGDQLLAQSDDTMLMRLLLAREYFAQGDNYTRLGKTDEAAEAYRESEESYTQVLRLAQAAWRDHFQVANLEWFLAEVLEREKKYPEAVQEMRKAMAFYDKNREMYAENLNFAASELADMLEASGQKDEASKIRTKYGVKVAEPKK